MESNDRFAPPWITPSAGSSNRNIPPVIIVPRRQVVISQFVSATGGTISTYTDAGFTYRVHQFLSVGSGLLTVSSGGLADILLVPGGGGGGGGGGSDFRGGGAGAGRPIFLIGFLLSPGNYNLFVGDGGLPGSNSAVGQKGGNTTGFGQTAEGGGFGGSGTLAGGPGGSGGGGGSSVNGRGLGGAATTPGDSGNNGGAGESGTQNAGGGGGATAAGQAGGASAGFGGAGLISAISGTAIEYCRGGNGRRQSEGGGNGTAGPANRGWGGNGAGPNEVGPGFSNTGGKGSSGIIVVRCRIA